jgi:hypothetical protein
MDVFFRRVPNTATDGEHVFAIIIRWGCSGVSMTLKATLESNDFVFAKNRQIDFATTRRPPS